MGKDHLVIHILLYIYVYNYRYCELVLLCLSGLMTIKILYVIMYMYIPPSLSSTLHASLPPSLPPSLSCIRYGVGYHMVVVKEPSCNSASVNSLVRSLVQGSKNITDVGTELSFVLPSNSSSSFPQLFDTLEGRYNM